jgi:hypothetical protein
MLESTIHKNRPLFKTTQHYLEAKLGGKVKFILRRNSFFPLSSYFVDSDDRPQYGKNFRHERIPEYAWYPPLSVMFKTNEPRPCHILRSHYQGIGTTKAKLQVAYFTLLKKGFIQKLLVPAHVLIDSENGDREKIIDFLGGMVLGGLGSKVKIFKFDEGKVLSLLKQGYDQKFLLNEITVRKDFQDMLPVPRLLTTDGEAGLFEEEYIPAIPVRELNAQTWPLLSDLFNKLLSYYKKNDVVSISTLVYQSILLNRIHDNSQLFSQTTRQELAETLSILIENVTNDLKDETLLVQGHGDFWLGNILFDEDGQRLLIIDWERSDQYSLMYDLFTLFAIYAIEQGNFKLLKNVLEPESDFAPVMDIFSKYQEQFSSSCDRPSLKRQFKIFLLERISFALSLLVTTPEIDCGAQKEFDKWHAFVVAILNQGILTDSTR